MRLPTPPNPLKRGEASALKGLNALRIPFKAMGPGSVSSMLKVVLDVAYILLWLITGVLLLLVIARSSFLWTM